MRDAVPKAMVVAGVMSGTSADGVDVALARVAPGLEPARPKVSLIGHASYPYPEDLRAEVLAAMDAKAASVASLSRLSWRLGAFYAAAVSQTELRLGKRAGLVGLHGQTIFHEAAAGAAVRSTWQTGEPALVAERLRVPVVSDFRPADLAAGGQGAPLVPMLDFCLFAHPTRNRVLLNLGGIANVTAIPAHGGLDRVLAFDTGPANMVVDGLMHALYGRNFDCGGQTAARGQVIAPVLAELLADPYFSLAPPKSCGREQFGAAYVERFATLCGGRKVDTIATATELTARSITDAHERFCRKHLTASPVATELVVAGGGVRNSFLMSRLTALFGSLGVQVRAADTLGMPAEAKEAVAFALLAWLSWHGLPGNVPAATGASRAVVLGRVTCG